MRKILRKYARRLMLGKNIFQTWLISFVTALAFAVPMFLLLSIDLSSIRNWMLFIGFCAVACLISSFVAHWIYKKHGYEVHLQVTVPRYIFDKNIEFTLNSSGTTSVDGGENNDAQANILGNDS